MFEHIFEGTATFSVMRALIWDYKAKKVMFIKMKLRKKMP